MSESVEQAALRRAAESDWAGRARREASAILDELGMEVGYPFEQTYDRNALLELLAIAWLQGVNLGCHETLADAEQAFDRIRDAL